MDSALDALEPNANGFIRQTFLEGEVEAGLTGISQLTSSLTDEANDIMNQVADIVALPHLNDSDVQEGVRDARRKRDQTIADLYEFDANQTRALIAIENDLKTMETWLSDIEGLFTDGVTAIDFSMDKWAALSAKNTLQTDLAQRMAGMDGVNGGQGSGDEPGNLVGANTSEDEQLKALYAAMEKEQHVGNPVNDYAIDPNTGEYLMTFEGKRKVLGGNGTGTIDGFAPYGMATYDFYLGDIGTMLSPDASANERMEAALFTFFKPLKLADTGHDILKVDDIGKATGKGSSGGSKKTNVDDFDTKTATKKQKGNNGSEVPPAFKQTEFASSYEARINQTPAKTNPNAQFEGARGESLASLKPSTDPKLKQILDEAGIDGIQYKNGVPDFAPVAKAQVEINHMVGGTGEIGTTARRLNFTQADEELARQFGMEPGKVTWKQIDKYRRKNKLTWHELNDVKTVQLVPTDINGKFGHLGGVGEINAGAFIPGGFSNK